MSVPTEPEGRRMPRVETGVPGLDAVLSGGLVRGGVNLVVGPPGTGKTVLGAQIAFHHAATGGRVVFLTVLSEPHGRLVEHLRRMAFFEERAVGEAVYFVSGYRELEKDGLPGLLQLVESTVRARRPSLLVIDGASVVAAQARTSAEVQRFTHALNAFLDATGCTGVVLSTGHGALAEEAMVEAVIVLHVRSLASRALRELAVTKLRGSEVLEGTHHYWIRATGLAVFPRIEAVAARAAAAGPHRPADEKLERLRLRFGVRELDAMTGEGLPSDSVTLLVGAPGSGKTLLGSTFLSSGADGGERGLYFGFFEPPPRLLAKLDGIGLPFRRHVEEGAISVLWFPPVERLLDSLAEKLLEAVTRARATRVVVDGIDGFRYVAPDPERLPTFLVALTTELRRLGATTLLTLETDLLRADVLSPLQGLSAMTDNVVFLRHVESGARFRRFVTVLKLRDGAHDPSVRAFEITDRGFAVAPGDPAPAEASRAPRRAQPKAPAGKRRRGRARR